MYGKAVLRSVSQSILGLNQLLAARDQFIDRIEDIFKAVRPFRTRKRGPFQVGAENPSRPPMTSSSNWVCGV